MYDGMDLLDKSSSFNCSKSLKFLLHPPPNTIIIISARARPRHLSVPDLI